MSQEIKVKEKLAANIKNLRLAQGLKQEDLSLALGFENSYISKVEQKTMNITLKRLVKIADYFKTEVFELLK